MVFLDRFFSEKILVYCCLCFNTHWLFVWFLWPYAHPSNVVISLTISVCFLKTRCVSLGPFVQNLALKIDDDRLCLFIVPAVSFGSVSFLFLFDHKVCHFILGIPRPFPFCHIKNSKSLPQTFTKELNPY